MQALPVTRMCEQVLRKSSCTFSFGRERCWHAAQKQQGLPFLGSPRHFSSSPPTTPPDDAYLLRPKRTSGRKFKRLKRMGERQEMRKSNSQGKELVSSSPQTNPYLEEEEDEVDNRTWRTILFPFTLRDPRDTRPRLKWSDIRSSPRDLYRANQSAWKVYEGTWVGFFDNLTGKKTKKDDKDGKKEEEESNAESIKENVKRNLEVSKEEGGKALEAAKEATGIRTMDDLKAMAKEFMMVATEILSEFMKEYRKGRDDEIEKMLHEYFQEEDDKKEEEGKKKRKRQRKRRIPYLLRSS